MSQRYGSYFAAWFERTAPLAVSTHVSSGIKDAAASMARRLTLLHAVRILTRAHQQIDFLALDLLFEDAEPALLPHVQHLVERAVSASQVLRESCVVLLEPDDPILDRRLVTRLAPWIWSGQALQFHEQTGALLLVTATGVLQCLQTGHDLRELLIGESERVLDLNEQVAVEDSLNLGRG